MAFPPDFLDELRVRLPLSEVVGKRLRLIRAGREFKSPCPFHNEKTPSFYVNDQKGFFHCFGCGAHGDIIGFVMRHDNLAFPEAVETLAGMAGLPVPRASDEDRRRYERRKTLHDVLEHACRWFEEQLYAPVGRAAYDYLQRRGLDAETMARFRLGYAPADSGALRHHLLKAGCAEDDMVTAGLLKRPDDGRTPYSFFRNRVLFPVTDRRGQVVAFGGRVLDGDGPKYINTGDTPLFHKGTLLYGLSRARAAAADGKPVIVAEGYMDVIGLVRAGFEGAVAPLGTALTETQVLELWKLIPSAEKEPYLCFDGDNAGRRAAWRAVERLLPHLAPGHSARVAFLPEGEDPDSLIRRGGARAMTTVLDAAIPLAEAVWRMETEGRRADTPEAKAAVKAALEARVDQIADRTVQSFYRTEMRRRVDEAFAVFRPSRSPWGPGASRGRPGEPPRRHVAGSPGARTSKPAGSGPGRVRPAHERFERLLLAALINHPPLVEEFIDTLVSYEFRAAGYDELRAGIMQVSLQDMQLDRDSLLEVLEQRCGADTLGDVLSPRTYSYGSFARPETDLGWVRDCLRDAIESTVNPALKAEIRQLLDQFRQQNADSAYQRIELLRREYWTGTGDAGETEGA